MNWPGGSAEPVVRSGLARVRSITLWTISICFAPCRAGPTRHSASTDLEPRATKRGSRWILGHYRVFEAMGAWQDGRMLPCPNVI